MNCPHCSHQILDEAFFRRTFDHITSKFQHLPPANPSVLHQWKLAGYDLDLHVKPAVTRCARSGSFNHFTVMLEGATQVAVKQVPVKTQPTPE